MTDAIRHRGPESDGFWCNVEDDRRPTTDDRQMLKVGLGHRRLSIIDLSEAGAQPMHYLNRYSVVYNGEIYNYVELKQELEKRGYAFASHCDTEVLLAAYACYGADCLQQFDGMFAFALWDEQERTLFCARDRFGEKPFNYTLQNNTFLFASEMKALWAAGVDKSVDNRMLLNYLTLGWVQNPVNKQQTFYSNIYSLPPSHYLLCKFDADRLNIQLHSYWDVDKEANLPDASVDVVKQKLLDLFTTSVQRRLRSDVAIGSSLSGGIDSSSVVAIVNKLLPDTEKQKTFSAVFPGFAKDESTYIGQVVKQFSIDNYQVTPTADDFIKDFETLAYYQEEPFQSASIYAQYKVYELAKQHDVTVILDGQGADEVLAGYTKYYHWYWQELTARGKWKQAKAEINAAEQNGQHIKWGLKNYIAAYMPQLAANRLQKKSTRQQWHHPALSHAFVEANADSKSIYKPAVSTLNDILYFNTMEFGLEELLRYADRNAMAHSREVRLPFLQHELVQFIFSLPSSFKIRSGFTKHILRETMQQQLPASIVWRKDKVGYEPPQQQWLQQERVEDYIYESRKKLVNKGILRHAILLKPVNARAAHDADNYDWRYLCAAQCL